jgi:hypothetical protein
MGDGARSDGQSVRRSTQARVTSARYRPWARAISNSTSVGCGPGRRENVPAPSGEPPSTRAGSEMCGAPMPKVTIVIPKKPSAVHMLMMPGSLPSPLPPAVNTVAGFSQGSAREPACLVMAAPKAAPHCPESSSSHSSCRPNRSGRRSPTHHSRQDLRHSLARYANTRDVAFRDQAS